MSKRTFKDLLQDAFFARDKASLAKIVKDAEAVVPDEESAPENDDDSKGKHASVHVHIGHKDEKDSPTMGKTVDERLIKVEDALAKMGKFFDALPKLKFKDGENPFAKKDDDKDEDKDDGDDGEEKKNPFAKSEDRKGRDVKAKDGENPFAKKDDDEDDDKEKSEDKKVSDKKTGDESGMGGELTPPESDTKTAMTAEQLTEVEPDLMDADPSLKTGKNLMGDAEYIKRTNKALAKVVKDVRARAEILAPGIKFGTIDAKPGQPTADALCKMRRTALNKANPKALGRFTANDMKSMSCAAVRTLFLDASDRQKQINNTAASNYRVGDEAAFERDDQMGQLKQINRANSDFWSKQLGKPRI